MTSGATSVSAEARERLAQAQSFLFVPADRPERIDKALASGADAIIVDLEDAVSPSAKDAARDRLHHAFASIPLEMRGRLTVRLNALGTPWHGADAQLLRSLCADGLGGVLIPKCEGAAVVEQLASTCAGAAMLPLIESGAGLDALDCIARAPGVLRLCLGHLDLQNDLGITCGMNEDEIAPARWDIVRASRRHSLVAPIDGVTADVQDPETIHQAALRAIRMGFGAKLCIHPSQVKAIHRAFAPDEQTIARAHRILQAAADTRDGVCVLDGRMVDMPVIAQARRVLMTRSRK